MVDELKQHQHPLPTVTAAEQVTASAVAAAPTAAMQFRKQKQQCSFVNNKISRNSSILHSSGSSSKVASPSEAATASQPAAAADASTTVYIY